MLHRTYAAPWPSVQPPNSGNQDNGEPWKVYHQLWFCNQRLLSRIRWFFFSVSGPDLAVVGLVVNELQLVVSCH